MTDTTTIEVTTATLDDPTALTGIDWAKPGDYYPDWRGLNLDGSDDIKAVAAVIRRELRKAPKDGKPRPATRVGVRYRTASMMQAIDVTITVPKVKVTADTPGAIEMEDRWGERHWVVKDENDHCAGILVNDRIEPGAREAKAKVEAFVATFNYNRSNTQVDYFDVRFYSNVTLRDEDGGWD